MKILNRNGLHYSMHVLFAPGVIIFTDLVFSSQRGDKLFSLRYEEKSGIIQKICSSQGQACME